MLFHVDILFFTESFRKIPQKPRWSYNYETQFFNVNMRSNFFNQAQIKILKPKSFLEQLFSTNKQFKYIETTKRKIKQ